MVLSNAERQARYRANLKEKAAGGHLPKQAREAAKAALAALWSFFNRPDADGRIWGDAGEYADLAAFEDGVANSDGRLLAYCRSILLDSEGMTPDERAAVQLIVDIADALDLSDLRKGKGSFAKLEGRNRRRV